MDTVIKAQALEAETAIIVEGRIVGKEDAIHFLICGPSAHPIRVLTMMRLLEAAHQPCMKTTTRWGIQDGLLTRDVSML